jgi:hypothetical protein
MQTEAGEEGVTGDLQKSIMLRLLCIIGQKEKAGERKVGVWRGGIALFLCVK